MSRSIPTAPSRRGFLAVLSAGAASAVVPAALAVASVPVTESSPGDLPTSMATPSPDAALLQLFDQYKAARSEYGRLSRKECRLNEKHKAATPLPDALRVQPGDADLGLPEVPTEHVRDFGYGFRIQELQRPEWPVLDTIELPDGLQFYREVFHYEPPSAAARARADEIIKAHAKWDRERDREPAALRAVSRQKDAAFKLADRLRSKIDRTRARSVAGLAVKAQVAAIEGGEDAQFADYTLASILRDMRALNGRARS
jgi:hypothetical protein